MDKKNLTIGIALLALAVGAMMLSSPKPSAPEKVPSTAPAPAVPGRNEAVGPAQSALPSSSPADTTFAAIASHNGNASITSLSNDFVEVHFTNFGGAVRDVAFKKYAATKGSEDPFIFNENHNAPILSLDGIEGADQNTSYELVSANATTVVYRTYVKNAEGQNILEITRHYNLQGPDEKNSDPYRLDHKTTFRNLTANPVPIFRPMFNIGTTALISTNDNGQFLNVATYNGSRASITDRGKLEGGGFFSWIGISNNPPKSYIEITDKTVWAAVKNQFFASIYTPEHPAISVTTRRVSLPPLEEGSGTANVGLTASMRFDPVQVAGNGETSFAGKLYVGPKEYTRLAKFENNEDKVMQFDASFYHRITLAGYISPFMNTLMVFMHDLVGNWGLAIVMMTILLKFITLPFTLAASRSAKRMQKLQPMMKELNEKYKDNPQKKQQATMQLFKENKVNPLGGCIPILITIPLFIGFFFMLMGTAELRFQPFLWNSDLSAPDTVARIFGLPINVMPLLMGATMIFQMRLTPQPSVDNMQTKMIKYMPIFFMFICYNFSAALALYSTVNGLFTICQQLLVNKFTKDTPVVTHAPKQGGKGGRKKMKNVTPYNKKAR